MAIPEAVRNTACLLHPHLISITPLVQIARPLQRSTECVRKQGFGYAEINDTLESTNIAVSHDQRTIVHTRLRWNAQCLVTVRVNL